MASLKLVVATAAAALTALTAATPPPPPPGPHGPPGPPPPSNANTWGLKHFTSLVVFGDSYTDDSRLSYFFAHNGSAPPVGWVNPVNYNAADGGRPWPDYVRQYSGANVYNYAVSGAVCSNDITPRQTGDGFLFPAVSQYEVPAYLADAAYIEPATGARFLDVPVDSTVYAIWIGTNDEGNGALLTDSQVAGTNLSTYTDCVYEQFARLYASGARNFVVMNNAPLNLAPQYALPSMGGLSTTQYWPDKPSNLTEISFRMLEEVVMVNQVYEYRTPFAVKVANEFPGSHWAVYNVHDLMKDIYYNPAQYLNGTPPLNVTGIVNQPGGRVSNPDSYMWYDPLHPSEQTERIIARNFVDVVRGHSQWATYWSSC